MNLGLMMDGGEEQFIETVRSAMVRSGCPLSYLEIGVAYGDTLKGVLDGTRDLNPSLYGIDIQVIPTREAIESKVGSEDSVKMIYGRSTEVLATFQFPPLSAVLIDACHCQACATADFMAVEPLVAEGGVVIFHDAGEAEQGTEIQPNCNEPIHVRKALTELGMFSNQRPGWVFEGMILSSRQCAVFQKVKTPLEKSDTVIA